ncbi:MAG TPA: sterol-binding protein [Thiolapillus brandeum]|uniref:Ubiquinone biosynthesis accessory factor UbiJ n=1 Tax=Thiolapillus brandeum TaxID=1076588 RepID=A0A831K2K6_9GAMM|nr:sterol-binding protein [Thiolapillus brandeum]
MSTRDLALESLERSINLLLQLDPMACKKLARHHGKVIGIHLRGPEITLYFIPDQQGHLQLFGHIEGEPDALLSGSPLDLLRSGDQQQGSQQLFAGRVSITGDTRLAHNFGTTLGSLDIDWEEQLSKLTGDILAHQIGSAVRKTAYWAKDTGSRLETDLGEYLTEETRLLPHPLEVDDFIAQVDELREQSDRLEARMRLLQKKLLPEQNK